MRYLILSLILPFPLATQQASPYIPIGHWSTPYVEHLISAGVITDPSPLTRPFKGADLVRVLRVADTTGATAAIRAMVRRLTREFETAERRPYYWGEASIGMAAGNYARRDPLRADTSSHAFAKGGLELHTGFGPVVLVTHPSFDTRLQLDPDWYGVADNASRFEEAYITGQWRYAELVFGVLDRNWGPSEIQGLLLSDNPYSLASLALSIGTPHIHLQGLAAQLDTRSDPTGTPVNRYMVQHRLLIRPRGPWTAVVWEASVLSGVGRQLEPWYLDIVQVGLVQASNTNTSANFFAGLDFQREGGVSLFGQFMLDDIQVSRSAPEDEKPASYGFTIGAKGRLFSSAASW